MNSIRLILVCFTFWGITANCLAQNNLSTNITSYKLEAAGSAASGSNTPFWLTNNTYGVTPLDAGNGYFRAGVLHQQHFNSHFYWRANVELIAAAPRHRNVFIQQLYGEIGYKSLLLSIGSKERYTSLWNQSLSSGDMILSTNARPIPEINISIPQFTPIPLTKEWLQLKGEFAVGRSFDKDYLKDNTPSDQTYIYNNLWHNKSIHLRIKDTQGKFPFFLTLGVRHIAQWGGTSTDPNIGKQPQSLKDFVRVVFGKAGGEGASQSDVINVLGAHHISYDFQLGYTQTQWSVQAYHQHLAYDKSGLRLQNGTDGLWGLQLDFTHIPWLQTLVFEYVNTKNQSGPFHFIEFDRDKYKGPGGGADDYYNNGEYKTGLSYFNRGLGSPLLTSPEYNAGGSLGFFNNRIKDWHIGMSGDISSQLSYRILFTIMNGWGTAYKPFLTKKNGTACLIDLTYTHPRLSGWDFSGSLATDTGNILGDNGIGFNFSIRKTGIIKRW